MNNVFCSFGQPPANFRIQRLTSSNATIDFDAEPGNEYCAEINDRSTLELERSKTLKLGSDQKVITNLKPNTAYEIKIKKATRFSKSSDALHFTTLSKSFQNIFYNN
jgi:hypothetical protein